MDSHKRSAQVERLEVVETGRRRRWSEDEKLKIVQQIASLFDHLFGAGEQHWRNCDGWCETLILIFALIQKDRLVATFPKSNQVFDQATARAAVFFFVPR
jgi:hypothetical protein